MSSKHALAGEGPTCPCCAERQAAGPAFKLPAGPLEGFVCGVCAPAGAVLNELPPFRWSVTPAEIEASADEVVAAAEANLQAVAEAPDLTFAAVVRPLMLAPNYKTNPLVCQSKFLQHCSTDAKVREAAEAAGKKFAAFKAASRTREAVFRRIQAFAETEEAAALGPYEGHFLSALLGDFKRGGLALDPEGRGELQRLLDADAACCAQYGSNLGSDATKLVLEPPQLEGLPPEFIKERCDTGTGKVTVTLKYPDLIPIMANCEVEQTRRQLLQARETAYGNNLELMSEGVRHRKATAALLGYPSWAHFVIETRMAGTPETVAAFLGKVRAMAGDGAAADLAALTAAKKAHLQERGELEDGREVRLEAWDTSFYHERVLKQEHGVDTESVREYFPLDHVVTTTLQIYQELLGLSFTEAAAGSFEAWHPEVRLFVVHDAEGGQRVGHFYLDLHPREGKYGHAAIFHLLKRSGAQTPVDCMLCNLPAPSKDGTPALLRHDDVVTFFHEFGHIMHGLCSQGEGNSTRLAKCPRDFVEAPSQMLENWCWEPAVLERLSRHYRSGEALTAELREKMVAAKNVHASVFMLRQIYLATLDLTLHSEHPPKTAEAIQALVDTLRPEVTGIANPSGANMLRSFGHLMNQYSAAYYGYMWAEVISADMFASRFASECMSKEAGKAYRDQVLGPGGTGKIMDHLIAFLGGREPQQEPFLRSRGILA